MKRIICPVMVSLLLADLTGLAWAGLEAGAQISLTIRGVDSTEQQKVSGIYRVGESGRVRLPLLEQSLAASGLTAEQFARSVEAAYKVAGIYVRPAIEVEILRGTGQDGGPAVVSVAGQVRRAGETTFRKGMTVIQALDAVGGPNEFGGRNVLLFRDGHQYCLDFTNLRHKSIVLRPGDSLQVEQKGIIDRWKGQEAPLKKLME